MAGITAVCELTIGELMSELMDRWRSEDRNREMFGTEPDESLADRMTVSFFADTVRKRFP